MPSQPELLAPRELEVSPADGLREPRLWVRRLAVWRKPGGEIIQDIRFRPGLNIVWSPDGSEDENTSATAHAMGHGSGKSLFCRLLRYCLGENRFAPEDQRLRIGTEFLDGIVGAEIVLDGVLWSIVRPLGMRRRHVAVVNRDLDEVAASEEVGTGLEPFLDAIEQSILTTELSDLVPGHRQDRRSWLIALAWLARDQECRFDDVLDWRSSASDSDSAARGLTQTEKRDALRAFLEAITPEEHSKRADVDRSEEELRELEKVISHRQWEIERTRRRMFSALGLPHDGLTDSAMTIELMRNTAQAGLAKSANIPSNEGATGIDSARSDYDAARAEVELAERRLSGLDAKIEVVQRIVRDLKGVVPGLSYSLHDAESPLCPVCEVPISRVLAEGCKLSDRIVDLETCRQRFAKVEKDLADENVRLASAANERIDLLGQLAILRQRATRLLDRLRALENARNARAASWYSARRMIDDVEIFAGLFDQQDIDSKHLREIAAEIERKRERVRKLRDQQARVFVRLSEKFDPIVRRLIGEGAGGRVVLTGAGLELTVTKDGDRSTAAIESLKVLAFDIAALCLSIEGRTRVPAFLVHDSPREADLGLPLYHQLFELMRWLETVGERPFFQYIVTTTTPPPADLATEPWLRLILRGAPAEERLLRCNL